MYGCEPVVQGCRRVSYSAVVIRGAEVEFRKTGYWVSVALSLETFSGFSRRAPSKTSSLTQHRGLDSRSRGNFVPLSSLDLTTRSGWRMGM